jgi:hypothetical protein
MSKHIWRAIISHSTFHMPSFMPSSSSHIHHYQHALSHMPYLTSHAIYMPCRILPCYFSHDLYHIIYLLFHIVCDTSLVSYVHVLFLRSCLSCATWCVIYHVIHRRCHIYGAIYACIASNLSYHMVYLHLCCHIYTAICEGTASKIFQTCFISCAIYTVSSGAISMVPHVPALNLRHDIKCAISFSI